MRPYQFLASGFILGFTVLITSALAVDSATDIHTKSTSAPHLERAQFGLAESLRGQHKLEGALAVYQLTLASGGDVQPEIKVRSMLGEGLMDDALDQRDAALKSYQTVLSFAPESPQASTAGKLLKQPCR